MERDVDRQIGAASIVLQILFRSVVVSKELNCKEKFSLYQSVYVPTKKLRSQTGYSNWKKENFDTGGRNEFSLLGSWTLP